MDSLPWMTEKRTPYDAAAAAAACPQTIQIADMWAGGGKAVSPPNLVLHPLEISASSVHIL